LGGIVQPVEVFSQCDLKLKMSPYKETRCSMQAVIKKAVTVGPVAIDPYVSMLLANISDGKHVLNFAKGKNVFSQGDHADAIYFVESGRIKLSVVSAAGKEGVLAMLGPHDFFGEGSLVGQSLRMNTAMTLEPVTVCQIEKRAMLRALRDQVELSEKFMVLLLTRNINIEENICDQLFNHSEKRLARVLLKLGRIQEQDLQHDALIPKMSHETLSEMVGTTRSRITIFMNKFKTMGLIDYNGHGHLTVRTDLLTKMVA
jgi:CRP/FNR family cyclic AMP-dependent transcriptional regulator